TNTLLAHPLRVLPTSTVAIARSAPAALLPDGSFLRDPSDRLDRALEPGSPIAPAGDRVEEPQPDLLRLHSSGGLDEGAVAGLGERDVAEGAGVDAVDPEPLGIVEVLDQELPLARPAEREPHDLAVGAFRGDLVALH